MSSSLTNRYLYSLGCGLALGVVSWAIVPFVSDRFEPFDSELAFYSGQAILSLAAFGIGLSWGSMTLFVYLLGVYVSNNAYPYIFGSSESRAWALLGLATTVMLCINPLLAGISGVLVKKISSSVRLTRRPRATK